MQLQDNILKLSEAIRESNQLLAVHIGGNDVTQDTLTKFFVALGIDFRDLGNKLYTQTAITEIPNSVFTEAALHNPGCHAPNQYNLKKMKHENPTSSVHNFLEFNIKN